MAVYPAEGSLDWDGPLKAYIDELVDGGFLDPKVADLIADPGSDVYAALVDFFGGDLDTAVTALVEDVGSDTRAAIIDLINSFSTTDATVAALIPGPSDTNLALRTREAIFYVDDFGAIGDGATDDREAVQDAIDAADALGGGMVMLGKGKFYACSGLIIVKNGVYLLGTATRQNLPPGDPPTVPGLVAYDDTFQFRIGEWTTT